MGDPDPRQPPPAPHSAATRSMAQGLHAARTRADESARVGPAQDRALPTLDPLYRVVRELGRGGMGAVYLAHELETDREVALKLVLSTEGVSVQRLLREGQLTGALTHPGIVRVHSAGSYQGRPCLVYELVPDARHLGEVFREGKHDRRELVVMIRDAALALGAAHAEGVIHRDVKPENILLGQGGRVRVSDFGLATAMNLEGLTQTGAIVGTPASMAPEQLRGSRDAISPATDVWGLGVVLYEALTREPPFRGSSFAQLMAAILNGTPAAPRKIDPSVPAALEQTCLRALALDPNARQRDASEVAQELTDWLEGRTPEPAGRRSRVAVALLVVLLAAALTAWFAGASATSPPRPGAGPPFAPPQPLPAPPASAQPLPLLQLPFEREAGGAGLTPSLLGRGLVLGVTGGEKELLLYDLLDPDAAPRPLGLPRAGYPAALSDGRVVVYDRGEGLTLIAPPRGASPGSRRRIRDPWPDDERRDVLCAREDEGQLRAVLRHHTSEGLLLSLVEHIPATGARAAMEIPSLGLEPRAAAFAGPDRLLVVGETPRPREERGRQDGLIELFSLGASVLHLASRSLHDRAAVRAAASPERALAAVGLENGEVHLYRLPDLQLVDALNDPETGVSGVVLAHPGHVRALAFDPQGLRLYSMAKSKARLGHVIEWDVVTRQLVRRTELPFLPYRGVVAPAHGLFAACDKPGRLYVGPLD